MVSVLQVLTDLPATSRPFRHQTRNAAMDGHESQTKVGTAQWRSLFLFITLRDECDLTIIKLLLDIACSGKRDAVG